jgi:site-specific DNA-methyltransferase (adenine-specific)
MEFLKRDLLEISRRVGLNDIENRVINQDLWQVVEWLPDSFVDLLFLDPPYNITKCFNSRVFRDVHLMNMRSGLNRGSPSC